MVTKRGKNNKLRSGYTTGACAAAAARAAALALIRQETISRVQIGLPHGDKATFDINRCNFDPLQGVCSVIKDAGDDPDITDGIEIWAAVSWCNLPGIHIEGGIGVGTVTKPGLEISVGLAAINPVPRQMIAAEVTEIIGEILKTKGVKIVISVPNGEALARKTLNPRLGILGGISILGTTGIVIPYSINAYTACISQSLDVAISCGCHEAVLTTGRRSEKFAQQELALAEECFIQAGDFIGFSLKECQKKRLNRVIIWGMIGKITKLANGHLYTNISHASVDMKVMLEIAGDIGVPHDILESLENAVSANHFRELLPVNYMAEFARRICHRAALKCSQSVNDEIDIECILSGYDGNILGRASAKG